MKISEITAFHVRIPLKKRIRHASYTRSHSDTVIVRARLDDRTEGWGEGLPREYVTGETIQTAFDHLRAVDFPRALDGTFTDLKSALDLCAAFKLEPGNTVGRIGNPSCNNDRRDCFGNSVRCALELSILDAVCRRENLPLSAVTPLVPETAAIRAPSERVQYSATITSMSPWKQALLARGIRLYGFRQCKAKVGVDGVDDPGALRRIRRGLGRRIDLRIDANEAWRCDNLREKLDPLLPCGISAVEQPVPHADVRGLAELRRRIPTPIMLDESLCSLRDARTAVECGLCDLFNIRLSKCGGFLNSLKLAAIAHQAGLEYQLGCQVGETGILSAAGRHFAASVANIRFLEGSYDRFLVKERLTVEDLTFHRGGRAPALAGPGLGIHVDENALRRVTVKQERFPVG